MRVQLFAVPLAAALCLTASPLPVASADNPDCDIVLPAADQLEQGFNEVSPTGTPYYVAGTIRRALAPLYGLNSAPAVDLRLRSDMLAAQIDGRDPYRPADPQQLASDLVKARQQLATSRAACAP
jgi:hypothetical protein